MSALPVSQETPEPIDYLALVTRAVPSEMREGMPWVVWKLEPRKAGDKPTKIPYDPRAGRRAKADTPATGRSFVQACTRYAKGGYAGLGVILTLDAGIICVDLDKCRDMHTGTLEPWALDVLRELDSYAEISPSGSGVHVWVRAAIADKEHSRRGNIEIYADRRFITITGEHIPGSPERIEDRGEQLAALYGRTFAPAPASASSAPTLERPASQAPRSNVSNASNAGPMSDSEVIQRAMRASNGAKFAALWHGDTSSYGDDASRADMALLSVLRFWTQDAGQLDSLFRQSGLMRDKWDERHYSTGETYGQHSIGEALAGAFDVWNRAERAETGGARLRIVGGQATDSGTEPGESLASPIAAYEYTEMGNRDRLLAAHNEDIRYNDAWGFVVWDGKRWNRDGAELVVKGWIDAMIAAMKLQAADMLRASALAESPSDSKTLAAEARDLVSWAVKSQTARMVRAVLDLTAYRVVTPVGAFDNAPMLFNCANGTIDLQTGQLRPHCRADMLTQISPIAYDPSAPAPRWQAFVSEVMCGRPDMAAYIQRALGYSITGKTSEQVWHLLIGEGENGKGKLMDAIAYVFGDYAGKLNATSILLGAHRRTGAEPSPDMASLKGKRLVAIPETPEGARIDAAHIKELSGEDPITARHLNREFFTFLPTHKLWIHTNHEPQTRDTGHAYWRRVRKVPFQYNLREHPERKDPELAEKLQREAAGILVWLVDGCLAWQREGLNAPALVTEATAEMRASQDMLLRFLMDRCKRDTEGKIGASELYGKYRAWAEETGERVYLTQTAFGRMLRERGFQSYRTGAGMHWRGLWLLEPEEVTEETVNGWRADEPAPTAEAEAESPTHSTPTLTQAQLAPAPAIAPASLPVSPDALDYPPGTDSAESAPVPSAAPWYVREPWYDMDRPDSSLSQALEWATGGDVASAATWYQSVKIRDRWQHNGAIIRLTGEGDLLPGPFIKRLHALYVAGKHRELAAIASKLEVDSMRIFSNDGDARDD